MKKIALTLLGLTLPVASALACSSNLNQTTQTGDQSSRGKKPAANFDSKIDMEVIQKLPVFKVEGKPYQVQEDGLYLVKNAYQGVFWSGDQQNGTQVDAQVVPLGSSLAYHVGVSLFSGGDSLYVLYNDDDNDGYSIANFLESFYLHDTNLITNDQSLAINRQGAQAVKLGQRWGYYTGIPFVKKSDLTGLTPRYYGEQSKLPKHQSWDESFGQFLERETNQSAVDLAAEYWNVKTTPNQSGKFETKDPVGSGASKLWYPIVGQENYFSYQITHRNAVKVTFNQTAQKPYIDAQFALARDNSLDLARREISAQDLKIYSVIVGGNDRHGDYLDHESQVYQFRALKKMPPGNSRLHKLGDQYETFHQRDASWLGKKLTSDLHFQSFSLDGIKGSGFRVNRSELPSSKYQNVFNLHGPGPDGKHYQLVSVDGKNYQFMIVINHSPQPLDRYDLFEIVQRVVT